MKRIYLYLLLLGSLSWAACSDDDAGNFDTPIDGKMFSFTPTEGGAVMHYTLTDPRVNRVKVEYTDEHGEFVYKVADYAVDTLLLDGFNKAHKSVPVRVSFLDPNEEESEVMEFTFDTRPSSLYAFFDQVEVNTYWNGFQVVYHLEGRAEGSASVYFVGTNPTTKLRDTIFLENFRLENGTNVKAYPIELSQQQESYTVMITTEDDRPRIARKQVWTGIKGAERVLLPSRDFQLLDPFGKSIQQPYFSDSWNNPGALGKEYLFDGDVKGTRAAEYFRPGSATPPFTFLAGPEALWRPDNDVYFVLDIGKPAIVGEMRFYIRIQDEYAVNADFGNGYYTKVPCNIQVFNWIGEGDYNPDTNPGTAADWEEIGSFKQDPNVAVEDRWYVDPKTKKEVKIKTVNALNAVEPIYLSIPFPFKEQKYRFLKIQFNETYVNTLNPHYDYNATNNVTFHELEVYGKK